MKCCKTLNKFKMCNYQYDISLHLFTTAKFLSILPMIIMKIHVDKSFLHCVKKTSFMNDCCKWIYIFACYWK